uniref:Uncharacterized protein n=1 Tax=viral metagenome TaxID=1070528 RepID=A0A6M3K9Q9_9ZZZZ
MIFGFGKGEEVTARKIISECTQAVVCADDEEDVRHAIEEVEMVYRARADEYDKMDRESCPERYTRFWSYVPTDPSYHIIFFTMHHVNRRHAMSPDGWALFITRWVSKISKDDKEITTYRETRRVSIENQGEKRK